MEDPVLFWKKGRELKEGEEEGGRGEDERVGITAHDPAKLGRRIDDEVLGETRDVDHEEGADEEVLGDKVTVRDGLRQERGVA